MKKLICLVLVLCIALMTSCVVSIQTEDEKGAKAKKEQSFDDKASDEAQKNGSENGDEKDDSDKDEKDEKDEKQDEENVPEIKTPEELIASVGAEMCQAGDAYNKADLFCTYIAGANKSAIASLTGGKSEYYGFLDNVVIDGFTLYPFEVTESKAQQVSDDGKYVLYGEHYLVLFNVSESTTPEFSVGENLFLLNVAYDDYMETDSYVFVPFSQAEYNLFTSYGSKYLDRFIEQFIVFYGGALTDGKNYPEDFDFSKSTHLITHLMANCGMFAPQPPYSLDEINKFITESFSGNAGIEIDEEKNVWTHSVYTSDDPTQLYGCSYAHGGDTVEHTVVGMTENEGMLEVDVQTYSDFSHFAKARRFTFMFDTTGELIKLMAVIQTENTGNPEEGHAF